MSASYTYASAKRVAAASGYDPTGSYSVGSRYATNMPRHLFKLATSYQLLGALHRWKVGGSVHVQDSISSTWNVRQEAMPWSACTRLMHSAASWT
jgi:outer membrane receptor for ferric coprogen and ferric-rhodotorulic acid